jgi:hypothetical protein
MPESVPDLLPFESGVMRHEPGGFRSIVTLSFLLDIISCSLSGNAVSWGIEILSPSVPK